MASGSKYAFRPGAQYGKMLRIREEGVPISGGRRGDLYLKLLVQVPQKLTKRGRELLEQLRENEGEAAEPQPDQAERAEELGTRPHRRARIPKPIRITPPAKPAHRSNRAPILLPNSVPAKQTAKVTAPMIAAGPIGVPRTL